MTICNIKPEGSVGWLLFISKLDGNSNKICKNVEKVIKENELIII